MFFSYTDYSELCRKCQEPIGLILQFCYRTFMIKRSKIWWNQIYVSKVYRNVQFVPMWATVHLLHQLFLASTGKKIHRRHRFFLQQKLSLYVQWYLINPNLSNRLYIGRSEAIEQDFYHRLLSLPPPLPHSHPARLWNFSPDWRSLCPLLRPLPRLLPYSTQASAASGKNHI